ncbi:substrate-binding domain-containing protein [Flavicella sp.]|uniref:substrate-binding domain-containing protein n=1 Tax=Flavicella sp. TaxID=2957742 RepID=UPI003019ED0F
MITIKDIAKEANVSEGTVDRVLHDRGGISKKTKELVKSIIKKYNFKTNPIARALAMKNKYKLSTLIPKYDKDNLFWKSPLMGILKASDEVKTYGIDVKNFTFDQFDSSSYLNEFNNLMTSNPTAVMIVPTFINETKKIVRQLEVMNIPYMFFNIDLDGFNNISFIGQNSYMGGYVAAKLIHLSSGSQPSILSVKTRLNINNYHAISKRIEGFNDYFVKNKIQLESFELQLDSLKNTKKAGLKLNSFLNENAKIKGIFVPSSRISLIANCIEQEALEKIQLVGFDNTPQNIKCLEEDKISFLISQKPFNQGYDSIHLMTDYLVKKKDPIKKIYSPIDILTKENAKYNEHHELQFNIENPESII